MQADEGVMRNKDERGEVQQKKMELTRMREAGDRGFRYPGLCSVVLGHLALLHELV